MLTPVAGPTTDIIQIGGDSLGEIVKTSDKKIRLALTGASGCLSRAVARGLRGREIEVVALGRSVEAGAEGSGEGDWTDPDGIARWIDWWRPTMIFHGAGSSDVGGSFRDPWADLEASFGCWSRWLEGARRSRTKPVMIYPSSAAVYGAPEILPTPVGAPCRPISPYGMHKWMCEKLAEEYHELHGVPCVVLRLFSVFGPAQRKLVVWEMFERLKAGQAPLQLAGSGEELRDFLHEDSVSSAVELLARDASRLRESVRLPVYNVASGNAHSIVRVASMVRDLIAPGTRVVCCGEARLGHPDRWQADVSLFREDYPQWQPIGIEEGLASTIKQWEEAPVS